MAKNIHVSAGQVRFEAQLNETRTAQGVFDALPLSAAASTWGDEIYFRIPVSLELEDGQPPANPPYRSS